ncbi:MAG: NADH-quinone oxidoreductase subunit H [Candidatus Methanomethylophilaceae archaeon]|nr:NADH-quinone oxidoreductase subunit H [Candidatus Methanomethylophilaceae archaeon]MBR2348656.1 NADH-quinone oxidoreductase subunit H [Candidatus Methanomethylophilaceae archaeon]
MGELLDWINFGSDPMANAYYPFDSYNLPFDIGYQLWEILGGTIAWLIDLIFPGNSVSTWLMCDAVSTLLALVVFMLLIFLVAFVSTLIVLWEERKCLGRMMDRRGTMVGMKGFLQCVADGLKTFQKENVVPAKVDKMTYMWTVSLVIGVSVLVLCMVPLSSRWFVVDYDTGLLIIMAFFALAPFFILVSGWAQNNKYSLIGGMRAAELMISYEVPMLILICTTALMAGSFNINDIVYAQADSVWYIVPQILGAITFFTCAVAEAERVPFDIAEAEAELVEGWQTEYAGMKWGLVMLADYMRGSVSCSMFVILYLGGWTLPFIGDGPIPEIVFLLKAYVVFFFMSLIRAATGRVRTDQILNLGWKVFMPLSVFNLVIVLLLMTGGVI